MYILHWVAAYVHVGLYAFQLALCDEVLLYMNNKVLCEWCTVSDLRMHFILYITQLKHNQLLHVGTSTGT